LSIKERDPRTKQVVGRWRNCKREGGGKKNRKYTFSVPTRDWEISASWAAQGKNMKPKKRENHV